MIYLIGIFGFIGGFIFGQMALYVLLRHKTNQEILSDPALKWTYGLANWVFASLGAYGLTQIYQQYFPHLDKTILYSTF